MTIEVLAEGLVFPEGPVIFPDGSVILVELLRGTLTRVWNGKAEVVCSLGGGPNGAALGPDGAIYVCNNGGLEIKFGPDGAMVGIPLPPAGYTGGSIDRVDLKTGTFERLFTHCGERPLSGPNDLVFDRQGGIWFTDVGKSFETYRDYSALYYIDPELKGVRRVHDGAISFNGVGLSPDEDVVYAADTLSARLVAFDLESPGKPKTPTATGAHGPRLVRAVNEPVYFDSLAVTEAGNVCVATIFNGGITTFTPSGETAHTPLPDGAVTNICFGGAGRSTAFVTLTQTGRLISTPWPEPGLALNFNPY